MTHSQPPLEWNDLWDAMKLQAAGGNDWTPTTPAMFEDMLNALPPAAYRNRGFLMGEPYTDTTEGEAVYACFERHGSDYRARYMTLRQFREGAEHAPLKLWSHVQS